MMTTSCNFFMRIKNQNFVRRKCLHPLVQGPRSANIHVFYKKNHDSKHWKFL